MKFGSNLQILLFVVLGYVSVVLSIPVFTGNAKNDFLGFTGPDAARYMKFWDEDFNGIAEDNYPDGGYGLDVVAIHGYYDERTDIYYQAVECDGVCGDSDADGNADGPAGFDATDMCSIESIVLSVWNDIPSDYELPPFKNYWPFFPSMIVGKPFSGCLTLNGESNWKAYEYPEFRTCNWPLYRDQQAEGGQMDSCFANILKTLIDPSTSAAESLYFPDYFLPNLDEYANQGITTGPEMYSLIINSTQPSVEYKMRHYSKYPGFRPEYQPGVDTFRMSLVTFSGNYIDEVGEDRTPPKMMVIEYDCFSVPGGDAVYDECGVCGGDSSSCWDCAHIPNGPNKYDFCGVCNGDNTTCWDCAHIPNGPNRYDYCGVCNGDNTTCWDCAHIPNGPAKYDHCGVCDGDNSTCWDCAHIPNGPNKYDFCGVCDGDNSTCYDCANVPNGPNRYDQCGVCNGDNTTCWDCLNIPNGGHTYDQCGICNGDGETCLDCAHVPFGSAQYDGCGVCGGMNETCTCYGYLGYKEPYLCYALTRYTIAAARVKITDTLDVLYAIKNELPYYDYQSGELALDEYVDKIHNFCDGCLDQFDFASVWFADRLAGNCVGAKCKTIVREDFSFSL